MTSGERLTFLADQVHGYLIFLSRPYDLNGVMRHLERLEPHQREHLEIVTLEVVGVTPAREALEEAGRVERDRVDTIPAPALEGAAE